MSHPGSNPSERTPLRLRMTGAQVLRDGAMQHRSVAIEDGRISKGPLPEVDLTGFHILPGIVDPLSDALTRLRAALPRLATPAALLAAAARDAAANGVTTCWVSQGWSWAGGAEDPAEALLLLAARDTLDPGRMCIDLRLALLCERHTVESREALLAAVRRHHVGLVLFTDRLGRLETHPSALPEALRGRLARARREAPDVPRHLCRLAEAFDTLGVAYGSLDDADGETRETYSMIGAKLCLRPRHRAAAALARAVGDPVLLPGASVLHERLAHGALPALDLVRKGLCDAFVSDSGPAGLVEAVFALSDAGILSLPQAWSLVSSAPASVLRLPDRGVIDYGRRADLTIVDATTRSVAATISAGRIAYLSGVAAERFMAARADVVLAAE